MIKILFVTSCKTKYFPVLSFIQSQADSIVNSDKEFVVDILVLQMSNIRNIFRSINNLRIKKNKYDIIHAHYATNCFVSLLVCGRNNLISSFLGSDIHGIPKNETKYSKYMTKF